MFRRNQEKTIKYGETMTGETIRVTRETPEKKNPDNEKEERMTPEQKRMDHLLEMTNENMKEYMMWEGRETPSGEEQAGIIE